MIGLAGLHYFGWVGNDWLEMIPPVRSQVSHCFPTTTGPVRRRRIKHCLNCRIVFAPSEVNGLQVDTNLAQIEVHTVRKVYYLKYCSDGSVPLTTRSMSWGKFGGPKAAWAKAKKAVGFP